MENLFVPEHIEKALRDKGCQLRTVEIIGFKGLLWQQVIDFFREKGLHVFADCNESGWYWGVEKTNGTFIKIQPTTECPYKEYYTALQIAIEEALELI